MNPDQQRHELSGDDGGDDPRELSRLRDALKDVEEVASSRKRDDALPTGHEILGVCVNVNEVLSKGDAIRLDVELFDPSGGTPSKAYLMWPKDARPPAFGDRVRVTLEVMDR